MPAKLGSSVANKGRQDGNALAVDREGTGETPVAGSIWIRMDPIPRGTATIYDWSRRAGRRYFYVGGSPRCPKCLKSSFIDQTGYSQREIGGAFHCNRCKVFWDDTDQALCYVCDKPFDVPPHNDNRHTHIACTLGRKGRLESFFTSYHHNGINHPFCPRCEAHIGRDVNHSRRTLRRTAGLR